MNNQFNEMLMAMKPSNPRKIAVAGADDVSVLGALSRAYELGFAVPVLFGDAQKIRDAGASIDVDVSKWEIVNTESVHESARLAVKLVRDGGADILMKGLIQTAELLRPALDRENGIRGTGTLSHVAMMHSFSHNKRFILTDVAMIPYPDLSAKVKIINNAVSFAHKFGIDNPNIACLAAVEVVNPKMPETLDADALTKMNEQGEITGCTVYGPLAFDLAVLPAAAKKKNITSPVAGNADIMLCHDIDVGNILLKSLTIYGGFIFGGVVMGADAPIIITSRSDNEFSKLYSIAIACSI